MHASSCTGTQACFKIHCDAKSGLETLSIQIRLLFKPLKLVPVYALMLENVKASNIEITHAFMLKKR